MRIRGIIWLEQIAQKVTSKHHLARREVEEVFAGKLQYRHLERGRIGGEDVYAAYGRTEAGRYVTAITARDMDQKERRQYER